MMSSRLPSIELGTQEDPLEIAELNKSFILLNGPPPPTPPVQKLKQQKETVGSSPLTSLEKVEPEPSHAVLEEQEVDEVQEYEPDSGSVTGSASDVSDNDIPPPITEFTADCLMTPPIALGVLGVLFQRSFALLSSITDLLVRQNSVLHKAAAPVPLQKSSAPLPPAAPKYNNAEAKKIDSHIVASGPCVNVQAVVPVTSKLFEDMFQKMGLPALPVMQDFIGVPIECMLRTYRKLCTKN